ncbi:hypothetical protein PISMIDRAFT_642834 [Pisolithus microcarpus 441]|uniref:Uncharacterized protein n=1 Tax=Pisolithus microcarpus 441 TaxID=765257 RepID=A0A0C9YVV7_9AGAM|nr:hypothetical protein BKA83DRAFT_642834 [Pisolithus microcarpus]KIK14312.1 hypothetical protein PISMIDRAFT_642834 [Pisolithus microcarpus 441]
MSFVDDKFLPSGNYAIINVGHNRPISFNEENDASLFVKFYLYTVTKWTIQGPSEVFVGLSPDADDGDEVASVRNPPKPHQRAIKRHSSDAQAYIIYSPSQPQLFWSLPHGSEGAIPQLSTDHDSKPSLWKFKRIESRAADDETVRIASNYFVYPTLPIPVFSSLTRSNGFLLPQSCVQRN